MNIKEDINTKKVKFIATDNPKYHSIVADSGYQVIYYGDKRHEIYFNGKFIASGHGFSEADENGNLITDIPVKERLEEIFSPEAINDKEYEQLKDNLEKLSETLYTLIDPNTGGGGGGDEPGPDDEKEEIINNINSSSMHLYLTNNNISAPSIASNAEIAEMEQTPDTFSEVEGLYDKFNFKILSSSTATDNFPFIVKLSPDKVRNLYNSTNFTEGSGVIITSTGYPELDALIESKFNYPYDIYALVTDFPLPDDKFSISEENGFVSIYTLTTVQKGRLYWHPFILVVKDKDSAENTISAEELLTYLLSTSINPLKNETYDGNPGNKENIRHYIDFNRVTEPSDNNLKTIYNKIKNLFENSVSDKITFISQAFDNVAYEDNLLRIIDRYPEKKGYKDVKISSINNLLTSFDLLDELHLGMESDLYDFWQSEVEGETVPLREKYIFAPSDEEKEFEININSKYFKSANIYPFFFIKPKNDSTLNTNIISSLLDSIDTSTGEFIPDENSLASKYGKIEIKDNKFYYVCPDESIFENDEEEIQIVLYCLLYYKDTDILHNILPYLGYANIYLRKRRANSIIFADNKKKYYDDSDGVNAFSSSNFNGYNNPYNDFSEAYLKNMNILINRNATYYPNDGQIQYNVPIAIIKKYYMETIDSSNNITKNSIIKNWVSNKPNIIRSTYTPYVELEFIGYGFDDIKTYRNRNNFYLGYDPIESKFERGIYNGLYTDDEPDEIVKFTVNENTSVDIYVERFNLESGNIIYNGPIPKSSEEYFEPSENSSPIDGNVLTELPFIYSDEKFTNWVKTSPFFNIERTIALRKTDQESEYSRDEKRAMYTITFNKSTAILPRENGYVKPYNSTKYCDDGGYINSDKDYFYLVFRAYIPEGFTMDAIPYTNAEGYMMIKILRWPTPDISVTTSGLPNVYIKNLTYMYDLTKTGMDSNINYHGKEYWDKFDSDDSSAMGWKEDRIAKECLDIFNIDDIIYCKGYEEEVEIIEEPVTPVGEGGETQTEIIYANILLDENYNDLYHPNGENVHTIKITRRGEPIIYDGEKINNVLSKGPCVYLNSFYRKGLNTETGEYEIIEHPSDVLFIKDCAVDLTLGNDEKYERFTSRSQALLTLFRYPEDDEHNQ